MKRIRKMLVSSALVVAGTFTCPEVTSAAPRVPGGETFSLSFPAGEICPFAISIDVATNAKTHDGGQGVIAVTGPTVATVTNLETEESRTYNISGPELNGHVDVGPWLILQPASRDVGPPFLILVHGRLTFTSINTIETLRGHVTDVCAALA